MNSYIFLTVGKTSESAESAEGYKRYIGVGSTYVLAVNPTKEELEKIEGREITNMPEYVVDGDNGKEARVMFILRTDPETNNGIEITQRLMFTLRNRPAYNRDQTKAQVLDRFGNASWADIETAKAGGQLPANMRIDQNKYRIACEGEADLVAFLKTYLCIPNSLNYLNGVWTLRDDADNGLFGLDDIKKYFTGDFSEIKDAIKLQPNNKIKLLYGVRTNEEGKQYQTVAARSEFFLRNSANATAIARMEKALVDAKTRGSFATTDFKVCELQEWTVEPTNLENTVQQTSSSSTEDEMPWD